MIRKFSRSVWLTVLALGIVIAAVPLDLLIMEFMQSHPECKPIFDVITEAGRSHWYLVPSGIVILIGLYLWRAKKMTVQFARWMHPALTLFLSIATSGIVVNVIKPFAARSRPREFLREDIFSFFNWDQVLAGHLSDFNSFPSGHAATALSVAMAIILCLPEKYRAFRIPVLVIGCVIAVSRVMVSVHYTSDVIVGALIGAWAAVLCNRYLLRAEWAAAISRPATLQ